MEAIEWQELKVVGGYVRRNQAGQFEFGLDIEGGYRLAGVIGNGGRCDWQGDAPAVAVTWREEEYDDDLPDTA